MKWALAAVAAMGAWFVLAKPTRKLVAGQAYRARFELPVAIDKSLLFPILPDGAGIVPINDRLIEVTFIAPHTSDDNPDTQDELTDLQTPFGTLKVISVQKL